MCFNISVKNCYAKWFFFEKDEPASENFVRINLPVSVLNRLGSFKPGYNSASLEANIEKVNEKTKVRIVGVGDMVQIIFYDPDKPKNKHKLKAKKLSLYRLALSKPEDNFGPLIDDIAKSNKDIDFLEYDRVGGNIYFQWPIMDQGESEDSTAVAAKSSMAEDTASSSSSATAIPVLVPVPVSTPAPAAVVSTPAPVAVVSTPAPAAVVSTPAPVAVVSTPAPARIASLSSVELYEKEPARVQALQYDGGSGDKDSTDSSSGKNDKISDIVVAQSDIEAKLEAAEQKVTELSRANRALSNRVKKLEGLVREASSEHEKVLKKEVAKYDKQLTELKASRDKIKEEYNEYINKTKGEKTDAASVAVLASLSSKLEELNRNKEALDKEFSKYKEEHKRDLHEAIEKFKTRINTLESKNANRQDALSSQESKFIAETRSFKEKVKVLQSKLYEYQKEKDELLKELNSYKSKLTTASGDTADVAASLKLELDNRKLELAKLKEEYEIYKADSEKRLREIEGLLVKEKETKSNLVKRLADASLEKKSLEKEAEDIKKEKEAILLKYSTKEEGLKNELKTAAGAKKAAIDMKYEELMDAKEKELDELNERRKRYQEAEAQLEIDLKAQLDKERFARMEAEEEIVRLKEEQERKSIKLAAVEVEKKKLIEEMSREAEQQQKILKLANDEEKKALKEKFKVSQAKKEALLEELQEKLTAFSSIKSEVELRKRLEIEMKKKLEEMIKEELAKGMAATVVGTAARKKGSGKKATKLSSFQRDLKPKKTAGEVKAANAKKEEEETVRGIPFDAEFENFYIESGLCDNWITAVYEDEFEVWIGTRDRGVTRYIKDEGNWICYSRLDGLAGNEISSITKYDNVIYVGTDFGLSKFDGLGWDNIRRFENIVFNNTELKVHDNILWVAARTMYGGLLTYDGKDWVNKSLIKPGEVLNNITCFEFQGDTLWIGTTKNGVHKYENRRWETLSVASGLVSNFIYSLAVDGDDIWIGSCCGLVMYNSVTYTYTTLNKNDGLASDSVYDIGVDGHAIWFATKGGISMYDGYEFENYKKVDGLADNRVTSMAITPEYVWFGSVGGLIKLIKEY